MRAGGGGPALALTFLLITSTLIQIANSEDIYWEGDDDTDDFLQIEDDESSLVNTLSRVKRGFLDLFTFPTEAPSREIDPDAENVDAENTGDAEDEVIYGSGATPERETQNKEKTLRVSFIVMEPYQLEYSNRDSVQFQNFSKSLADAVNVLYENLPGTQRASLVRIQSRVSDEFSCKVTLDIVTSGYDDTELVTSILKDHIINYRALGSVAVSDDGFTAILIDPSVVLPNCESHELRCANGQCVSGDSRCNGQNDCPDGSDEEGCPSDESAWGNQNQIQDNDSSNGNDLTTTPQSKTVDKQRGVEDVFTRQYDQGQESGIQTTTASSPSNCTVPCTLSYQTICQHQVCDGVNDCQYGDDELNCDGATPPDCQNDEMSCDDTRCVLLSKICDGERDCDDGKDEENCEQSCGVDDFRCNNNKCIEGYKRCDRVVDCASEEDEQDCECREDEFKCVSDGSCISSLKRCDEHSDCKDNSDEENCPCSIDEWQCDFGHCIKRHKRCDGRIDCPSDRSDERHCLARGFRCSSGKIIPEHLRCNREYDCPPGDYSDEKNCPCGEFDFKCDNGYCIPPSKHCDQTHDCQDGSDEKNCTSGTLCMASEFKCANGECIQADARCNGSRECSDGTDEQSCPCKQDEFHCIDGSCINSARLCNGIKDCLPIGEDERNCGIYTCPSDKIQCGNGSCAELCNNIRECPDGEDEDNCETDGCYHRCDGRCLTEEQFCNGVPDCSDNYDELYCDHCDRPEDFRCSNGDCIKATQRCNNVTECTDGSDELDCTVIIPSKPTGCIENQFQCGDGTCIQQQFFCDNHADCEDNSDEENCGCDQDSWECGNGQCIFKAGYCDGNVDCDDGSDENNCNRYPVTTQGYYTSPAPPTPWTAAPPVVTEYNPYNQEYCNRDQWRCENGPCISNSRRCDGHVDCPSDDSDELDCPAGTPAALNLKTYPSEQSVRYGGDVVFQCRDEGPQRAPVRWIREGGRPLKPGSIDRNGRLEIIKVSPTDSGTYICQAPRYLGSRGAELRVNLIVEAQQYPQKPSYVACQPYEATCGDGQCIPKTAVCNGKFDCADKSDEENCNQNGACEPNQFQCANHRCVLKSWLCDSDDDCGDGSDELNCGMSVPGQPCSPVEYACNNNQCIPKSFHCDGQNDCLDNSDEIGCAQAYIRKPPQPQNVRVNSGDALTLSCEAVGIPTPLITWRLNWGHVPQKCSSTSINGVGTLVCPQMSYEDSGAYSCEAINNKGTTFAVPDAIVYVNQTNPCPRGYFNSEAHSSNECIRCFCFGESTQCKSADLFTYNLPTPLGEGGTRLVGVNSSYNGEVQINSQPINDMYYYQPLRNGATITKLDTYVTKNAHPYVTLPESYNGNQLTSYGGFIRYRLFPHSERFMYTANVPDIIIKGKYGTLLHTHRHVNQRVENIEVRMVPEHWQKSSPRGLIPASREDIMMALDNIEQILLRGDLNGAGVNITDFSMESAQHANVGLGAATLVEECQCPPGYEGLSCQKCAGGYKRESSGPWLGNCVREEKPCPPGTYGDPNSGLGCSPCPCPLTNRENQFARTCSLNPSGRVVCDCMPGYEGPNCEMCAPGYVGNPLVPGDSCRQVPRSNCNPIGTSNVRLPDQCECKDNVRGQYCDQCNEDSFYLSEDFRHGCAQCFCSGVTQQCRSSNLRRKTTTAVFNTPQLVDQVKIYQSAPMNAGGNVRYNAPVESDITPILERREMSLVNFDRARPSILYWSLPASFSGDKVTAYGGFLRYFIRHEPPANNQMTKNSAPDVQLISDNSLTFHYYGNFPSTSNGYINASVQFLEKGWLRPDGKEVQRENLLLALADVKTILIKATYTTDTRITSLLSASIDTAEPYGEGAQALHVEECVCPQGYLGTSCEDCAPGYTRSGNGLYLEHCGLCECNGHSEMCHPETGVCYNCADNTDGENCEFCKQGYEKDRFDNCVRSNNQPGSDIDCNCDIRGKAAPCDNGRCVCKPNVEGELCDRCRPGTFALSETNSLGCLPCYCSGVTNNCHEAANYTWIQIPALIFGENYGGYVIMDINAEQVINDQFVPATNESELMYIFSFPPDRELYWSLPEFPGNRILSYGGTIHITQKFETGGYQMESVPGIDVVLVGDDATLFWTNPNVLVSGSPLSYQVPLTEENWQFMNTIVRASRNDFMNVLQNLRRVLVRATLTPNIQSTAIADVSMDTAIDGFFGNLAKSVEVCLCPQGYTGTSCESCSAGYYKDRKRTCRPCPCNGHECTEGPYGDIVCNCRPPYTGQDCSTVGLIMELHPSFHDNVEDPATRSVTVTCKYKSPEPLTIQFYYEGKEINPPKNFTESKLDPDGWHGQHEWTDTWDASHGGHIVECHAITKSGSTLGMLTIRLPTPGGDSSTNNNTRPPPPQSTVVVRIASPTIKIQEIGGSVNFTCQAMSRMSSVPLRVTWSKADGYLPQERTYTDEAQGLLMITNLQASDSGRYICMASDGVSMEQAAATLQVPGNEMTIPTVSINPTYNEYNEGDRIELQCVAKGNPTPRITWQRAGGGPSRLLPLSATNFESLLIIDRAYPEDSGDYRCIATNSAGSVDRTAVITVRPRPSRPSREKLSVTPSALTILEGQSSRIICSGTPRVPPGSLAWIRQDGTDLNSNIQSNNGVLYIESSRMENQGVYICQTNAPDVTAVPILVTITPITTPPPSEVPNVTVQLDRLKIPTGGSGVIECSPSGYPLPLIRWKKHQGDFGPSTSQRDNSLIISNAQDSDQGYYLCEGTIDGTPVANVYVFVDIEKREAPKVEIWPQGEQAVPLGGTFEFHCRVLGGIPEPDVMWDRNGGRTLSPETQIQPQNVLRFGRIDVNDEGEYTCTATNIVGTNSASAVLKVRSPPELIVTPNYVTAASGEPIEVECRASGYPEPMVSLRQESPEFREIVPPSPGLAVLRISSASESNEGTYNCIATSAAGTIDEQFAIAIDRGDISGADVDSNDVSRPYPPVQTGSPYDNRPSYDDRQPSDNRPENMISIEGQDSVITCNSTYGFDVQWRRGDRQPLQPNAVQVGNQLRITKTSKADSGYYECSQINPQTGSVLNIYTNLDVMRPPRITLRPPTQTVLPGETTTVECVVDGDDIQQVLWKPLSKPLSRRVEIRESLLIFNQIEVEDAGQYECFARNRVANASATAKVIVNDELSGTLVESHEHEQHAHVGVAVQLSCNVTQPNIKIQWIKDGRPLPRTVQQKSDGSLYIQQAQKFDSGNYVCIIQDEYGSKTTDFINLFIDGRKCLKNQFVCYDDSGCINEDHICDGYNDCDDASDEDNCISRDKRVSDNDDTDINNTGPREEAQNLVSIDQPGRPFRATEYVQILCRAKSRDIKVKWERSGTNQFVASRVYGDGAMLMINEVQEADAGVYRCIGRDSYGRTTSEDFKLDVIPGTGVSYPENDQNVVYTARLNDTVILPCTHNLEEPVSIEWRREYLPLPPEVRRNDANLHLERVTEADVGTYICRVSNSRTAVETRAILKVAGIVPRFDGNSWLSLPTLKDAFSQFFIEIYFKPADSNGLIFYNSQNQGREGDFLALQLENGIPRFSLETGSGLVVVEGNRPLQLNVWHSIRITWINTKAVTMDVDNTGPFTKESSGQWVLDLKQNFYIGGVPDYEQLPYQLSGVTGYVGCVSMLILGKEEKDIMTESYEKSNIYECDTCSPNLCKNEGVCQEARNERGYICLCPRGFTGLDCGRIGQACQPGICGEGKCSNTDDGIKCSCPVTSTGERCEHQQSIEYPAFTGSAYLAIKIPQTRFFRMSMKIKAKAPVTDGIIMYCAESARGYGGFTSLAVREGKLEFRYDLGDGSGTVVLTSSKPLPSNEWTDVYLKRLGEDVSMNINMMEIINGTIQSKRKELFLDTPLFVGGYDDSIVLNNNTGVTGGFNGCIKQVNAFGEPLDIVNSSIQSANIQECVNNETSRGDIPENENVCAQCLNGGFCRTQDAPYCSCPSGFTGLICENRVPQLNRLPFDPCGPMPCRNGGICKAERSNRMKYTCDCPLGFAGANCQMPHNFTDNVGFNGNGYLELPGSLIRYDLSDPAIIALRVHTNNDGVLFYQREALAAPEYGQFIMLRVEDGKVIFESDLGDGGVERLTVDEVTVTNGESHRIIAKLYDGRSSYLEVDGYSRTGQSNGFGQTMRIDSNIYIGGIPETLNVANYKNMNGCFEQVEFMEDNRGLNLGAVAVAARNTQRCRN